MERSSGSCREPFTLVRSFLNSAGSTLITYFLDVIESISFKGPSQTIKTHHNVGGIAERLMAGHGLKLIEPLRELFKDEVRELGRQLNISEELVGRHPFPGMFYSTIPPQSFRTQS